MATVATIAIKMDAQTALLERKLSKVEGDIKGMGGKISGAFGRMASSVAVKAGVAAAGFLTIRGAIRTVGEEMTKLAEIADRADRLGIGAAELQQLQRVAKTNASNAATLNMGLQRLHRNAANAAKGSKELAGALESVGINVERFSRMDPVEQMKRFADALNSVDDATRWSVGGRLLDSEGLGLMPMLSLGSAEIEALMERYKGLTEEQIRTAQDAAEAWTEIGIVWENFKQVMVIGVLPYLRDFANILYNIKLNWSKGSSVGGMVRRVDAFMDSRLGWLSGAATKMLWDGFKRSLEGPGMPKSAILPLPELGDTIASAIETRLPAIAAASAQGPTGYSALLAAQRAMTGRDSWEMRVVDLLGGIRDAIRRRESVIFTPVDTR